MSKPLVLCIDDDVDSLSIRKRLLDQAGYEVVCAVDGASGLKLFEAMHVDIVIIDYAMPGQNGIETAVIMRKLNSDVPIVMLSGEPAPPPKLDGEIDRYIVKGVSPHELLVTIGEFVSRHGQQIVAIDSPRLRKQA